MAQWEQKAPTQVANPPGNQPASPQKSPSAEDVHFIPEQINSLTRNEAKERPSGVKEHLIKVNLSVAVLNSL